MKYNFSEIKLKDIDGKIIEKHYLHKVLANGIHVSIYNLVDKAVYINKGLEVELDKSEIEAIKGFILSDKCEIVAFCKKAIIDYIDNKTK